MSKVVCFGEIMMRLSPKGNLRFAQATGFDANYGGSEANVAVSLAQFGIDAAFVSKVPDNELGQSAINELRKYGVDTTHIVKGGERLGLYFLETGASQRPSKVIYDRKNSAISQAGFSDFNFAKILGDYDWFHFTGITPALSDNMANITLEALKAAKKLRLKVSCDLNYRKNLWSSDKANEVMSHLMEYVDILISNEEDCEKVFGIKAAHSNIINGKLSINGYKEVAQKVVDKFNIKKVAFTLRESLSATDNNWSAMLFDGKLFYQSKKYNIHIVDRVGTGDAFGAGLIYALIRQFDSPKAIDFAAAASCLKHTVEGDFNQVTFDEVTSLYYGDGSGRVQR